MKNLNAHALKISWNKIEETGYACLQESNYYKIMSGNTELDKYTSNKTKIIKNELLDNMCLIFDLWNIVIDYLDIQ